MNAFICDHVGLTMEDVTIVEVTATSFDPPLHYWKATQPIGSLFGAQVHGECSGIGPTREVALQRLKADVKQLHESLWY